MVVDGSWSLIGSANWDARSLRLNFEMTVEFRDDGMAADLERTIDARRGKRLTLSDLDKRPIVIKLRGILALNAQIHSYWGCKLTISGSLLFCPLGC